MYSRRQENSNMNRNYGQSSGGDLAQGVEKRFATPNQSSGQQTKCLSNNRDQSKIDFSIFHGQNSNLQRNPVEFSTVPQNRSYRQSNDSKGPNQSLNLMRNSYQENNNFRQTVEFRQQSSSKNNKVFPQGPDRNWTSNSSNNSLGCMGLPKPNTSIAQNSSSSSLNTSRIKEASPGGWSSRVKKYGDSNAEKMCIFNGTVERVIKWGKIFQNHFCYYEVIAAVVSIADGKVQFEKIMLLRDKKGPILQVTYYSNATHINIEDFHLGQMLRAVGRIIGPNIMSAITIRAATSEEIENLPRMCYISDRAVATLCGTN